MKKIIIQLLPPFVSNLYFKFRNRNANPPIDLRSLNSMRGTLPSQLYDQVEYFISSKDFLTMSKYWRHLMLRHLKAISIQGIDNWGTSVARNYFTWTTLEDVKLEKLAFNNLEESNFLKVHKGLTAAESYSYNIVCNLLWNYLKNLPGFRFGNLKSSSLGGGNSPTVEVDGVIVTQDLLNSAIEYESFKNVLPSTGARVLEIGSGSGRNVDFILSTGFVDKYVIIDIPPASFISFERVSSRYPDLRIFSCTDEIMLSKLLDSNEWDILFLTPSLAHYLPEKFFDLTLAIDCLHEMTKETRVNYSRLAAAKSRYFYVKIWRRAFIPVDREYLDAFDFGQYGFDKNWKTLKSSQCVFPADFHEHLFAINGH